VPSGRYWTRTICSNADATNDLRKSEDSGAAKSGARLQRCADSQNLSANPVSGNAVDTGFDTSDPNLVKVIDAWPTLPEPIRRAMLALIG
jgi:hypothetical protein